MGMSKGFALVLILVLTVSSLVMVKTEHASASVTKPSVPEFTLKYIDYSYYVPPTYGIDQYTGQNVTIQGGYQINNRTMMFTIKNQPFTPYNDSSKNYVGLYYNFRYKGHFGDTWSYYPFVDSLSVTTQNMQEQTTHSYGPYGG